MSNQDKLPDHFCPRYAYPCQGWAVVIASALFFFYEFIQMTMFNVIGNPYLMNEFHINASELGFLASGYFWGNVLFIFPVGLLLDRFSTRRLLVSAMLVSLVATVAFSFSHYFWLLCFFRIITGFSSAFGMMSSIRLASRWFRLHQVGFVIGIVVMMAMLGGVVGQAPMHFLTIHFGWREAVLINSILGFIGWIILFICVRDYPSNFYDENKDSDIKKISLPFRRIVILALANKQNWLSGICTNFLSLPIVVLGAVWGIPYLSQAKGFSSADAAYISSMIFVGTIIGSPVIGWFSDKIGRRKLPLIIGSLVSCIIVLIIMYLPHGSLSVFMMLFALLAFFASSQVVTYPLVVESNPLVVTSTAEGISCTLIMLAGVIFQPLYGWLMDTFHSPRLMVHHTLYSVKAYDYAMWIFPITLFIALIIACCLKETYCRSIDGSQS